MSGIYVPETGASGYDIQVGPVLKIIISIPDD